MRLFAPDHALLHWLSMTSKQTVQAGLDCVRNAQQGHVIQGQRPPLVQQPEDKGCCGIKVSLTGEGQEEANSHKGDVLSATQSFPDDR